MPLISVSLPSELVDSLGKLARQRGVRRSVLMRSALEAFLARQQQSHMAQEVERQAGATGLFDSGVLTRDERPLKVEAADRGRTVLPFRFLGEPVVIDPSAPPVERDSDGNPLLPGGYYANNCEVCGASFIKHDDGECPEV